MYSPGNFLKASISKQYCIDLNRHLRIMLLQNQPDLSGVRQELNSAQSNNLNKGLILGLSRGYYHVSARPYMSIRKHNALVNYICGDADTPVCSCLNIIKILMILVKTRKNKPKISFSYFFVDKIFFLIIVYIFHCEFISTGQMGRSRKITYYGRMTTFVDWKLVLGDLWPILFNYTVSAI